MRITTSISTSIILGAGLIASPAEATLVEFRFEGVVTGSPSSLILPSRLDRRLAAGAPVSGRVRYDTTTPDSDPETTEGWYVHRDRRFLLELEIGGLRVATSRRDPELIVQVLDQHVVPAYGFETDRFAIYSRSNTRIGSTRVRPDNLALTLDRVDVTDSDALPSTPFFGVSPATNPILPIRGELSTFTATTPAIFLTFTVAKWSVVPEPSTALLLLVGLLGMRLAGGGAEG